MAKNNDQERTEKPTGKRRSKARRKGQVPKSRELSTVFILFGALGVFLIAGPWMFRRLCGFMQGIFQNLSSIHIEGVSSRAFLLEVFEHVALIIMPLLLVLLVVGVLANVLQVGFLFTLQPFSPKWSKFNPISGMKKFLSLQSLVELLKSMLKILFIGGVSWLVLRGELDALPSLMEMAWGRPCVI